ncbi:hypothetical protein [Bacillus thuringiensis]|uniref:hypothetical protein n=1 Tax=Bacillus thuringiensis TaxID=1428 RepID=UPI00111EFCE3|nr:hypothetical protein [Bacillus thuringiensis]
MWGLIGDLLSLPEKFRLEKRKQFIERARIKSTTTRYERNPAYSIDKLREITGFLAIKNVW